LGLLLLQSLEAAAFAALLFALHPVHIESVCWVSASDELLYVTFFLTSIFIFARFRDGDRRKLGAPWLYVLLWGAALLTKETAVALLPVFPIMAFLENKGTQPLRNRALGAIRVCIPTFLTAAVYLVARFLVLRRFGTEIGQHTWRQVFFTGVDLLAFYIEKLIIPFHLSPFYANPVLSDLSLKICGTILLVAIAIPMACWITIRYEPLVGLATSLILLPIVPALVGVRIFRDGDLAHDRYLFLPSVGICLLFGLAFKYCWLRIPFPRQLTAVLGTILLLALGWLNFCQQSYYRDDDAFFKRGLEVGPTNSLVMAYLGDRYLGEGKKELGLAQLREASTISPDNPEALFHLARGLFETKHYAEAEPYLRRLSQDNRISWPRRSLLTLSLAQTELQLGKLSSAETTLQGLATTNDSLRGVHQSLGALYEIQGKLPEAQREYEREFQVSGDIRSRRRALVLERQGGRM
jgi:predicted negative regulator of RcsB-dependent stress response